MRELLRTLVLCLAFATPLAAQQFVAELEPGLDAFHDTIASSPIAGNGVVYFAGDVTGCGLEPLVTDGTVAGTRLFVDLNPGPAGSYAQPFGVVGASVLLRLPESIVITDGTSAGTNTLRSVLTGNCRLLGITGSRFVWAELNSASNGSTLWSSDGTAAGTFSLGGFNDLVGVAERRGGLTFASNLPTGAVQLYWTNGLTVTPVATLPRVARSGFAALGTHDYILVENASAQATLWRTDGTTAGTSFVANLGVQQGAGSIATSGGQLFVGAANQLWVSNGTAAGTTALAGVAGSVTSLTALGNGVVYLSGLTTNGSSRLCFRDAASASSVALDSAPGTYRELLTAGANVFCTNADFANPRVVRTDGTLAGTRALTAVLPRDGVVLAPLGNDVIAMVDRGTVMTRTGRQAFRTDGSESGTLLLTKSSRPLGIRTASSLFAIESTLFFSATTDSTGQAETWWRTDGTASGTRPLTGLPAGVGLTNGVHDPLAFRGALWFANGNGLWRHDGGAGPALRVLQPDPTASYATLLAADASHLVCGTFSDTIGFRLHRSDGTPGGTVRLYTGNVSERAESVVQVGSHTFWMQVLPNASTGALLLRSDGSPNGSIQLSQGVRSLARFGDSVYFHRIFGAVHQLCVATTTSTTAQVVVDLPIFPRPIAVVGSRLVLIEDFNTGQACSTDATGALTLFTVPRFTAGWFEADGFLYTVASTPAGRPELWRTDGTVAGTGPTITFGSSALGTVHSAARIGAGNRIFLDMNDGLTGSEPWIGEGTQATTTRLADLAMHGNSSPKLIGVAGERAYFVAFDPVRGRELWSFDLAAVGAGHAQPFGVGCAGSNGVPLLAVEGMPAIGRTLSLRLERGAANALGLWLLGTGPQRLAVGGGCEWLMTSVAWSDWAITDPVGAATTSLSVPSDPVFVGLQFVAQAACLDALAPAGLGITGSEGVLMVLGG